MINQHFPYTKLSLKMAFNFHEMYHLDKGFDDRNTYYY